MLVISLCVPQAANDVLLFNVVNKRSFLNIVKRITFSPTMPMAKNRYRWRPSDAHSLGVHPGGQGDSRISQKGNLHSWIFYTNVKVIRKISEEFFQRLPSAHPAQYLIFPLCIYIYCLSVHPGHQMYDWYHYLITTFADVFYDTILDVQHKSISVQYNK